ncbi:MAG: VanZ family protein [Muribaculaceae bacterium]|nr:VanZ family protein [Muribaculaceae bacterium]
MRKFLSACPPWIFSLIVAVSILWLTLAPKPLGEEPPMLFPGADKLAHALMFGGFAVMLMLDRQRKNHWRPISLPFALLSIIAASFFGIIIEFLQASMGLGRSFEAVDVVADIIGAFLFPLLYIFFQNLWLYSSQK